NGRFDVTVGGVRQRATLIGRIADAGPGLDAALLTDIAQAQEWLGAVGRLSRIEVRVAGGAPGAALAWLRAHLPADLELHATRAQARETFAMTDAFTTNLKAMSLLALLVGTFLIYGAVSFAVLQRRATIAVLRALGATRGEVLAVVLGEAAVLGVVGALCGVLLGVALGRGLVGLVSQTINDLYFVVTVNEVTVPVSGVVAALCAGPATALAAALLPALGGRMSPVTRLACGDIAASLSRTGVASAALGMALTAMIGVAIMVESFRESLREWLIHTLRADVYVSAPGPAEASERRLDPA